jgi:hypothetical protein
MARTTRRPRFKLYGFGAAIDFNPYGTREIHIPAAGRDPRAVCRHGTAVQTVE